MKEIGGYFELEHFKGPDYYPDLLRFNLGRTAAVWYLAQAGCRKLLFPRFLCSSVTDAAAKAGIGLRGYAIRPDFTPDEQDLPAAPLPADTFLYVNLSYGLVEDETVAALHETYRNVLVDFTHCFFRRPLPGTASVTSVRKFFGVTDGAYLFPDRPISVPNESDESHGRFTHILGRFEEPAGHFYRQMLDNAGTYADMPAKRMSALTYNLLCGIDYEAIAAKRQRNVRRLTQRLSERNPLFHTAALSGFLAEAGVPLQNAGAGPWSAPRETCLTDTPGAFCYPFLVKNGIQLRKALAAEKVFVPTYWNNVISAMPENSVEYQYAANILALPCDQRYTEQDMDRVADTLLMLLP